MKLISFIFIILTGAGLMACSSFYSSSSEFERYTVKGGSDTEMDSLVAPYRRELIMEMGKVIGRTETDLTVARPNSTMGQWITDLTLEYGYRELIPEKDKLDSIPVFVLLNLGGLRASVGKGDITVGDIYTIMPFDNLVVAVKVRREKLKEIHEYLLKSGGEPVSNLTVSRESIAIDGYPENEYFWIITSDFAANGGDRMYFFSDPAERINSATLLRNLMQEDLAKRKVIDIRQEERIKL